MRTSAFFGAALVAVAAFTYSPSVLAESPTLTKIKSSGAITLGYRESSVPFSYLGPVPGGRTGRPAATRGREFPAGWWPPE
jgi:ABC-type amino acid transport substrate-binding protein